MIEEGALPQDIDRALTSFGFAMGPCAMLDMAGQDVAWFVRQRQLKAWPPNMRYSRLADLLYERGRLGSKVGAGWYRYPSGPRSAEPDPEVEAMIVEEVSIVLVSRGAASPTARFSIAASMPLSTRARVSSVRASFAVRATSTFATSTEWVFRLGLAVRCAGPTVSA